MAGRRPRCSRPMVGSELIQTTSPTASSGIDSPIPPHALFAIGLHVRFTRARHRLAQFLEPALTLRVRSKVCQVFAEGSMLGLSLLLQPVAQLARHFDRGHCHTESILTGILQQGGRRRRARRSWIWLEKDIPCSPKSRSSKPSTPSTSPLVIGRCGAVPVTSPRSFSQRRHTPAEPNQVPERGEPNPRLNPRRPCSLEVRGLAPQLW